MKTIEKCHNNCKTCEEGGTDENNNCKTCKNEGKIYFDLGNCKESCFNGHFLDSDNITKCYRSCQYYYYFENQKYVCTEENKCLGKYNKLILPKKQCIDSCINDNKYIYEYEGICYQKCPNKTIPLNNNMCMIVKEKICPEEYPYLIKEKDECTKNCSVIDLFSNICNTNNPNIILKQNNFDNIRNAITSNSINYLLI